MGSSLICVPRDALLNSNLRVTWSGVVRRRDSFLIKLWFWGAFKWVLGRLNRPLLYRVPQKLIIYFLYCFLPHDSQKLIISSTVTCLKILKSWLSLLFLDSSIVCVMRRILSMGGISILWLIELWPLMRFSWVRFKLASFFRIFLYRSSCHVIDGIQTFFPLYKKASLSDYRSISLAMNCFVDSR